MGGVDEHSRSPRQNAFRRSVGRDRNRHTRRAPRGFPRPSRALASSFATGDQLPGSDVCALKMLGVERIISVSAAWLVARGRSAARLPDSQPVFRPDAQPGLDIFRRRNRGARRLRQSPHARTSPEQLAVYCDRAEVKVHRGGTYVCMEGPQFSTLAESHTYRQLRFDVIGMTNLTEAKLAREAELCYAAFAMITDYDCWHRQHDLVTLDEIIKNLLKNAENVQRAIREAVRTLGDDRPCKCGSALMRTRSLPTAETIPAGCEENALRPIIGKSTFPKIQKIRRRIHVTSRSRFGCFRCD